MAVIAISVPFIPKQNLTRALIAMGVGLLGLIWFLFATDLSNLRDVLTGLGTLVGAAGFSVFLFCQKFLGLRYQLLLASLPIFAALSVLLMGGLLLRQGEIEISVIQEWSVLGFCLALFSGGIAVSSLALNPGGIGKRVFAGAVFNRIVRDYGFWLLAILFSFFYDAGWSTFKGDFQLGIRLSAGVLALAIFPILFFLVSCWSLGLSIEKTGEDLQVRQSSSLPIYKKLLSFMPDPALRAIIFAAVILSCAAFLEIAENAMQSGQAFFSASLFLVGMFLAIAFVYSSLRMALMVTIVFGCSTIIVESANLFVGVRENITGLALVIPKMLLLFSLVNIARVWSELLHDQSVTRSHISLTLAKSGVPTLSAFAFAITGLFVAATVMPEIAEAVGFASVYGAALMVVAISILVPAMTLLRQFRVV